MKGHGLKRWLLFKKNIRMSIREQCLIAVKLSSKDRSENIIVKNIYDKKNQQIDAFGKKYGENLLHIFFFHQNYSKKPI